MKKWIPLLLLVSIVQTINAQIYKISDYNKQTLNFCKGQFVSSQFSDPVKHLQPTPTPGYTNNEDYTVTFCSGDPNRKIRANFFYISLETNYDFLYVYDGAS